MFVVLQSFFGYEFQRTNHIKSTATRHPIVSDLAPVKFGLGETASLIGFLAMRCFCQKSAMAVMYRSNPFLAFL